MNDVVDDIIFKIMYGAQCASVIISTLEGIVRIIRYSSVYLFIGIIRIRCISCVLNKSVEKWSFLLDSWVSFIPQTLLMISSIHLSNRSQQLIILTINNPKKYYECKCKARAYLETSNRQAISSRSCMF